MDAPLTPIDAPASTATAAAASSPLRALRTETKLSPKSHTQRARVLNALARVAAASVSDVVKEDGHRFFVIDVHLVKRTLAKPTVVTSSSSSPLPTTTTVTRPSGPSDLQVKRRFSAFVNLRHELYYHAHAGHRSHTQPCAFCVSVIDVLTHAPALPTLRHALFRSNETLRHELDEFLNLVLQLASQVKNAPLARWCEGRAMIPLLVKQFVLGDDGESDASVRSSSSSNRDAGSAWTYTTAWSA